MANRDYSEIFNVAIDCRDKAAAKGDRKLVRLCECVLVGELQYLPRVRAALAAMA